jgi:peptide/nickel transport system permease protein
MSLPPMTAGEHAAEPELGVPIAGTSIRQLTGGRDVTRVPIWRIRLRLMRRSLGTTWGLFRENRMGMLGLTLILIFAVMAIVHPILMATVWEPGIYDPVNGYDAVMTEYTVVEGEVTDPTTEIDLQTARLELNPTIDAGEVVRIPTQPAAPTWDGEHPHYLGTDARGRDILSQLLYSTRAAFFLGAVAAITTVLIATTVGAIAAYFGGWIDSSLMRFADLILLMPLLPPGWPAEATGM